MTLDQEGARRGELLRHSLQLGDDTVTVNNIATMGIQSEQFQPYRTTRNRRHLSLHVGFFSIFLVVAVLVLAWWGMTGAGLFRWSTLWGWGSAIAAFTFGVFALRLNVAMDRVEPFFRLRIGASDGRHIDLVDDNKDVLERIRDAVRLKIDTQDYRTVGTFDLDRDVVNITRVDGPGPA
ncbi:MAG: hypothetical protein AAF638_03675 [Pseudomonadota bacterium]